MNDPQFQQHGGPNPSARPHWKGIHHSPFFWISAFFILVAMTIYVMTNNLSRVPGQPVQPQVPAIAP